MADHKKYDRRVESLVMEIRTHWDDSCGSLTSAERAEIARLVHAQPEMATRIGYERTHTGFIREITITQDDLVRLGKRSAPAVPAPT